LARVPHQQREVDKYNEYHRRLLTIKPGITGMAQVSGRSDLPFEDEYRLDVYYIESWSLWLDIHSLSQNFQGTYSSKKKLSPFSLSV
jgi:lipopolysaccharide/colanic/teichoic acid biosynthesis glycosyltransferase